MIIKSLPKAWRLLIVLLPFLNSCHKDKSTVTTLTSQSVDGDLHVTSSFTIPADSIKLNPTNNAPLSALINFTSGISGHTVVVVEGKNGAASDIRQVFNDNSRIHSIPVLGLYAGYSNKVDIYVVDANNNATKSTVTIITGSLTGNLPNYIHVDVADAANMEPGLNLVSSFAGFPSTPQTPYMVDSFGDIRWLLDFSNNPQLKNLFYDCGISRLQNSNFYFANVNSGNIYEVDVLGKVVNTWGLGGYTFHHNVTEKPNGNFLVTVTKPGSTHPDGSPTVEDYVVEIDRASGNIINTWDLKQSLNEFRQTLASDPADWIHTNAVIFDPSDNTIIISGRVQGIVKLTTDNHVKWILSNHTGWGKNGRGEDLSQFLLTPLDASGKTITDTTILNGTSLSPDFEWNWYQHSPILIPNGDLMIFDNGSVREFNTMASSHYSRAVEYKIDPVKMTVQQIWQYGKERGTETFSTIVSSVKWLPGKSHVLFSPGYQVPNITDSGGKIVEIDYATGKIIFQISISSASTWGWHRVERLPLYPNGNPYSN